MRIGIDISVTEINQAGTAVYTSNLVNSLKRGEDQPKYHLFSANLPRKMGEKKTMGSRLDTLYRDLIWTHIILPRQARRARLDVLHMPANIIPVRVSCPTVVTILDTTVLESPQNFTLWHRNYSRFLIPWAAKHASRIITISEQSKRDIVRLLGIDEKKVVVTHLAASSRFQLVTSSAISEIKLRYKLRDRFILIVGTLEPRKNLKRLLRALSLLRQYDDSFNLVHAGPQGWLFEDIMEEVSQLELGDSVRFLGHVPLNDLVVLYNAATLFVYPSLYEGFGLPVLEAMSCGCPVVTSNISSLPEVIGDAGILVDPYNEKEISAAIKEIWLNDSIAKDLGKKGLDRSKIFSWERCARETYDVYLSVRDF